MKIEISTAGIDRHQAVLAEEKKQIRELIRLNDAILREAQNEGISDLSTFRNNHDLLNKLEKSISSRIVYLEWLTEHFSNLSSSTLDSLDEAHAYMRRLMSDYE
jgi:hypothetical protein